MTYISRTWIISKFKSTHIKGTYFNRIHFNLLTIGIDNILIFDNILGSPPPLVILIFILDYHRPITILNIILII